MSYTPPQVNPNGDSVRLRMKWSIQASSSQGSIGGGTNTAATVAIAADAGTVSLIDGIPNVMAGVTGATSVSNAVPNIIGQVWWSYNGSSNPGNLTIAGATVGTPVNIDVSGNGSITFDPPLQFNAGEAVTVTLGALASATGKVFVNCWKLK